MANVKAPLLKRSSTAFLQMVIVLIGIAALAFLLWEPHVEGVNTHATLFQMYFNSFVIYVYAGSILFFVALYQAFRLLGYAGRNEIFSQRSLRALRILKYCALALIGVVAVSVVFMIGGDRDDRPAGLFLRVLISFPSIIVAAAAAIFERILQSAVDLKSENELTI
jgi:cytochrome bd-type quinol oxidase subunit 2